MRFCILHRNSRWLVKWRESDFCEKLPVNSAYTLRVKNFVKITISHLFRDKCAFAFDAEIQDGCQKWRKCDFCLKLPVDSSYTLRDKNFVKIALSRNISKINSLLHFTQKFNIAAKSYEKLPVHSGHPCGSKISTKSLYLTQLRR